LIHNNSPLIFDSRIICRKDFETDLIIISKKDGGIPGEAVTIKMVAIATTIADLLSKPINRSGTLCSYNFSYNWKKRSFSDL
jgi:hypothetical protein